MAQRLISIGFSTLGPLLIEFLMPPTLKAQTDRFVANCPGVDLYHYTQQGTAVQFTA